MSEKKPKRNEPVEVTEADQVALHEIMTDPQKFRHFFALTVPLHTWLAMHQSAGTNMICCPFHGDRTPSARVHFDPDGVERIWCFTCHKMYTSFDYVKLVLGQDPRQYLRSNVAQRELALRTRGFRYTPQKREEPQVDLNAAAELLPDTGAYLRALYPHVPRATALG